MQSPIDAILPVLMTPKEKKLAISFIGQSRTIQKVNPKQDLMIAVVWLFPGGKRLFDLFPKVIMVDVTMQTNKEDWTLFLLVIQDSQAKYIPILKIFLPNQKRWIFRWVFQNAIPSLLGKNHLTKFRS